MKNLIWQLDGYGWVTDDAGAVFPLQAKPALSFAFEALYLEQTNCFYLAEGQRHDLTDAQVEECNTFIDAQPKIVQALVMGVNSRGKYLGMVPANEAYRQVDAAPYSNDHMRFDFNTNTWLLVKAVDKDGNYLGNVDLDDPRYFKDVQSVPPFAFAIWDFAANNWKDGRTLDQLKTDLSNQLDLLADQTALAFISPGQTQTARYEAKRQQCQAYKDAGYPYSAFPAQIDPHVYPYVYWEANQTGQLGQQMADNCLAQAQAWADKGGRIEGYRIGGKKAINVANDPDSANKAYAQSSDDLKSLLS